MATVKLKVAELRKEKGIGQQEYVPRNTDNHHTQNGKADKLYKNRKYFWNDDYLRFLINSVWDIDKPIEVIDFRCCDGYLGQQLLKILSKGSTYTGVDNEYYTNKAKLELEGSFLDAKFIVSDIYSLETDKQYDLAISQCSLRHMNKPLEVLKKMVATVKKGGIVACIDVNREFENDGLYIDGIDYEYLCTTFDFHEFWRKELKCEGRDYAIIHPFADGNGRMGRLL